MCNIYIRDITGLTLDCFYPIAPLSDDYVMFYAIMLADVNANRW